MRAWYVDRSIQLPPNVKAVKIPVVELVLENWKSQDTMSDKSVLEERNGTSNYSCRRLRL